MMIIFRYIIVGGIVAFVNLCALYFLTEYVGFHYLVSVTFAFIIAVVLSFVLQKFWTFQDHGTDVVHKQASIFFVVAITNFFLNFGLIYFFVEKLHIWYLLSQFLISAGVAFISFVVYRRFIFLKKETKERTLHGKQCNYQGRDLEAMFSAKNYHQWIADGFSPYLSGHVGEVGAGSGNFSSFLLKTKIDSLVSIEPSQEMYPLLVEKFSTNASVMCRQGFLADFYKEYTNHFDAMVYTNVLEHIEDDRQELLYMNQVLKQGGYVCIFVPALSWLYSDFDASVGHYRRYQKEQLKKIVEEAGFEIVKISYFDIVGVIPWLIFSKLFKKQLTASDVSLYDVLVVPLMRVIEAWVPIPVGKNLIVIGRKKT